MGFWGWRQAAWMAFISVLVVACTDATPLPPPAASPTPRPLTLTLQGSPGAPPATPRPTLAAVTATPDDGAGQSPVEILPPTCSDTAGDGYQCVGVARNVTREPFGVIWLHAELYDGGEVIERHTLALEQRVVPLDTGAPYRFLFTQSAEGPLLLSFSRGMAADAALVALDVRDASSALDGADYVVTATLSNPADAAVRKVRAVATLYDGGTLVSFRVVEVESIAAGGTADIAVRWYAVAPNGDYSVTLSADAVVPERSAK